MWLSVIEMLRKKDKLPVVSFVFSKRRIEETASSLGSVDLLAEREKSEVHIFFQHCVAKLKGNDRELPQVCYAIIVCVVCMYMCSRRMIL